jgi:hypothetical protein
MIDRSPLSMSFALDHQSILGRVLPRTQKGLETHVAFETRRKHPKHDQERNGVVEVYIARVSFDRSDSTLHSMASIVRIDKMGRQLHIKSFIFP